MQFLGGSREQGMEVRQSNVTAAIAVANIVKSSLGPTGLDKMLVDDIGDVTITNDGATILSQLSIDHPAARLLVDLATLQDKEVGDGTTSVVLLAAELLRRAQDLISKNSLHPTAVITGYRQALKAAIGYLKKSDLLVQTSSLSDEHLMQAARTSLSSKLIGGEDGFFARMAVQAVQALATDKNGVIKYPLGALHIVKVHGKSSLDSQLLPRGFCIHTSRAAQGMPTYLEGGVKIALLDMNLQRHRMGMGVQMQVTDPKEVERIKQHEMDLVKQKIQMILDAGAKVILTTKGIDDIAMKYFVEAGALCARRVPLVELQRLAKATGATIMTTFADMEGNESVDPANLGECHFVQEVKVGDTEVLQFHECKGAGASTVLLRGANEYMLDEIDRALHDAACVVKRLLESNSLVPGGGAVEAALSVFLQEHACTMNSREQVAFLEFADAVLVIPKQLAINAGLDSSDLVAQLRSHHAQGKHHMGLDLFEGTLRDNLAAGVVEPAISKIKSLRFATEAAITILRIDDRITVSKRQ